MIRRDGWAKKPDTIRAFVALDLDAMSMRRVVRIADRLRMASGAPSASWTPQGKMHVTLKFMAALPLAAVPPLTKALATLVEGKKAPVPGTCRLQAFPSVEQAHVIVVELTDPHRDLAKLAAKIEKLASRHGVEPEPRPFRPHATIARLKRPYDSRRWLNPDLADATAEFQAACLTLYRSDLGGGGKDAGPEYVPLAKYDYIKSTQTS